MKGKHISVHSNVYILALMLGFLIPHGAIAQGTSTTDGNLLLVNCKAYVRGLDNPSSLRDMSTDDQVNAAHCIGYVTGVVDDHFWLQIIDTSQFDPAKFYCIPSNTMTSNQIIRVITKWLEDHPSRLHEQAATLVIAALRENFPCKQSK
jgi:hypothetical protein